MKKQIAILFFLLLGSLSANFYLFNRDDEYPKPCDNTDRYSKEEEIGVLRIKESDGAEYVGRYRTEYPPDQNHEHPTGYVLTKRVFDEIFENTDINSVTLDLVTYNDNLTLVVKGYKTNMTKIGGDGDNRIYLIKTFCPDNCSQW